MADKTFKVSPGEEIEITIRRRRQDAERIVPHKKKRGVIDPFRQDEFLPRRLVPAPTGMLFYDLGQLAEANYVDEPYTLVVPKQFNNSSANFQVSRIPNEADYRARESYYLANLANLQTIYRQLKPADTNPLNIVVFGTNEFNQSITLAALNTSNPNWTDNGLKVTDADLANTAFGVGAATYCYSFRRNYKITTDYNPASTEFVGFTPTNSDIYFLMPNVYWIRSQNKLGTKYQYLNYFYRAAPRSTIVDPANPFYPFSCVGQREWFGDGSLAAFNSSYKAAQVQLTLPQATLWEANGSGDSYVWTSEQPPSGFNNVYPGGSFSHSYFTQIGFPGAYRILLAIIKQGENYFYVWSFINSD